jgi:glutamyl/glutaminyl-tRNA synthetase
VAKDRELSIEEVEEKIKNGVPYVIRLKSLGVESPRQFRDEVKGNILYHSMIKTVCFSSLMVSRHIILHILVMII